MSYQEEEAIFDHILQLLDEQRRLLREKLNSQDHARFSEQSQQIRDLIAELSHHESAGRG